MIHSVIITNQKNESIEIELTNPETSEFVIGEGGIEGLGPEQTNINSTDNQIYDGASFDSAVTGIKNIVFHLLFYPNDGNVERVRHNCYKYFPVKELVKIEIRTDERCLCIGGYVESNLPTIFEEHEGSDISILCMNPYFNTKTDYLSVIRGIDSFFTFPFSNNSLVEPLLLFGIIKSNQQQDIIYTGELITGVKMKLVFSRDISQTIWIQNLKNDLNEDRKQSMKIDMSKVKEKYNKTIEEGDYLLIDTSVGNKEISFYKYSENKKYDASVGLNIANNKWIMFYPGFNSISITDDPAIMEFKIENKILYGGV